jgi:hypothetical protein
MNPSNSKSTGLAQRSYSTPEHDALQLWLFSKDNQLSLASFVASEMERSIRKAFPVEYKKSGWVGTSHAYNDKEFRTDYYSSDYVIQHHCTAPESGILDERGTAESLKVWKKKTEFPIYGYKSYVLGIIDCQLTASIDIPVASHISQIKITYREPKTITKFREHSYSDNYPGFDNGLVYSPECDKPGSECNAYTVDSRSQIRDHWTYRYWFDLLIEIKPRLDSISSLVSQIKIYEENLYLDRKAATSKWPQEYMERKKTLGNGIFDPNEEANMPQGLQHKIIPVVVTSDQNTKFDAFLLEEGIHVYHVDNGVENEK